MERDLSLSFRFPPGFRFHPSDQELITHYLQNKVTSHPLPALVIAEIDLYKYNPWELPNKALFGEDEWYFFSPRDRKYPNGARPNRAAASGYWKATGTDKPILAFGGSKSIGVKKSLVFYAGRPPKGIKTDWIMNEYRLPEAAIRPSRLKGSMRLDDWVLCRVRQKGIMPKDAGENHETESSDLMRYSQTIEKDRPTFKYVSDTTTVDLYKDCQLMASLLAGYSVPAMDTISSISFQGSNKGASFNSGFSEGTDKLKSPNEVTSINNHVNALKRLHVEENRNDEPLIQPSKKQNPCSSDEDLLSKVLAESDLDQYNKVQYQDNIFNLQTSDSIIDFQELTDLAFSDRFIGQ